MPPTRVSRSAITSAGTAKPARVSGVIVKIRKRDFDFKGYKSDKTDHIAVHKGSVLRKLSH